MLTHNYQSDNYMLFRVCQYKIHLRSYVLSLALLTKHSCEPVDVFCTAACIFLNLFIKIFPLMANFDHLFEVFHGLFFAFLLYVLGARLEWGMGCTWMHLRGWGDILNIQKMPIGRVSAIYTG